MVEAARMTQKERNEAMAEALRNERAQNEARVDPVGKRRVEEIDAALKRLDGADKDEAPRGRAARQRSTTAE